MRVESINQMQMPTKGHEGEHEDFFATDGAPMGKMQGDSLFDWVQRARSLIGVNRCPIGGYTEF